MRVLAWLAGILGALVVIAIVAMRSDFVLRNWEPKILNSGPGNTSTPDALGIPFERIKIASGPRELDAFVVRADGSCTAHSALLVFHGQGETVGDWVKPQALLREHCISSLVFDYSGSGASSPHGSLAHLKQDGWSAYAEFVRRFPDGRRCVMSHSMGAGPLLEIAGKIEPAPDCLIIANVFTSMRDFAVAHGTPRWVMSLVGDIWDNERNIAHVRSPIMVVHSRADRKVPFSMGERVFAAAPEPKQFVALDGFTHNGPYKDATDAWWGRPIAFIAGAEAPRSAN